MNKILLVIQREYVTRVLKKSFWISSLLAPMLLTAIYAIPIWLAMKDKEQKQVIAAPVETLAQKRERIENELRNKPRVRLDIV